MVLGVVPFPPRTLRLRPDVAPPAHVWPIEAFRHDAFEAIVGAVLEQHGTIGKGLDLVHDGHPRLATQSIEITLALAQRQMAQPPPQLVQYCEQGWEDRRLQNANARSNCGYCASSSHNHCRGTTHQSAIGKRPAPKAGCPACAISQANECNYPTSSGRFSLHHKPTSYNIDQRRLCELDEGTHRFISQNARPNRQGSHIYYNR